MQPNRPKRGRPARGTPADSSQTKKSGTPDPKPKRGAPRKDGPKDFFTSKAVKSRKKPEAEVAVHLQLVPEEVRAGEGLVADATLVRIRQGYGLWHVVGNQRQAALIVSTKHGRDNVFKICGSW